jgi:hypothetical protein
MADAVLRERLLVGGAALALLVLIVLLLVLIVLLLVAAFVALAWLVDRYRQADARIEQILTETLTRRATPDLDAGCDRLLDAIHEHRKENPL